MEDNFNTPRAIAAIFDLVNRGNSLIAQNKMSSADARGLLKFLRKIDKFFDFIFWKKVRKKIPQEILKLVKERECSRKEGNFEKSDEFRQKIKEKGYRVEEHKTRTKS